MHCKNAVRSFSGSAAACLANAYTGSCHLKRGSSFARKSKVSGLLGKYVRDASSKRLAKAGSFIHCQKSYIVAPMRSTILAGSPWHLRQAPKKLRFLFRFLPGIAGSHIESEGSCATAERIISSSGCVYPSITLVPFPQKSTFLVSAETPRLCSSLLAECLRQ